MANISLYMVAVGFEATRPCLSSFGGDQFDEKKQRSSFFNWSFMIQNVGMMISTSAVVWLETNVSSASGLGVSVTAIALALVCFSFGTPMCCFQQPGGSPLTKLCQVIIASIRKYDVRLPSDASALYELSHIEEEDGYKLQHTDQLR
ncbi:protein NRT1/ PTR FAMILY 8.2-like [Humulus lupulus]|uniref:protein NRT1/ PTR FAMILY 8.2-like n=1 Tax=Humulus lupulus TaxID=3486 RepID=UPI002B40F544|nr:protein NRT1/ PTR FAMILY 8.2-like [Humulus lupulus]